MSMFTGSLTSFKTTAIGAIPLVVLVVRWVSTRTPPGSDELTTALGTFFLGLFARDSNVTSQGGKVEQVSDGRSPAVMEKLPSVDVHEAEREAHP